MLIIISLAVLVPFLLIVIIMELHKHFEWPWLEKILSGYDRYTGYGRKRRFPIVELIAIPLILITIIIATRNVKVREPEFDNGIAVVADSSAWRNLKSEMGELERIIRTPQEEKAFIVHYVPNVRMLSRRGFQYFVLLADRQTPGEVSEYVFNGLLTEEEMRQIEAEGSLMKFKRSVGDLKLIAILAGQTMKDVQALFSEKSDSLYAFIESCAMNQWREALFSHEGEADIADDLMKEHGWALKKQSNLLMADNDPDNRFVSFGSWTGKRWMFITWEDDKELRDLTKEWIIDTRNRIGNDEYSGIAVENSYLYMEETTFLGRPAVKTRGLWGDEEPVMGGPFTNYSFYDRSQRRLYMIDMFVYRPGRLKLPYLLPMEVLAHTFVTEEEMQ